MKKENLDLSKLKQQINSLKEEEKSKNEKLGIETNQKPKNNFLKDLVEAYQTNSQNKATQHLKQVAVRSDDYAKDPIMSHVDKASNKPAHSSRGGSMYDVDGLPNKPNVNEDNSYNQP